MYKKDGCVWPDYNTYLLDCKICKDMLAEQRMLHRYQRIVNHIKDKMQWRWRSDQHSLRG